MNGRVFDPKLGRMLSPDPVTQAPENGQNYNRYSYAYNNPLKYTDPSGYSSQASRIKGRGRGAGHYDAKAGSEYNSKENSWAGEEGGVGIRSQVGQDPRQQNFVDGNGTLHTVPRGTPSVGNGGQIFTEQLGDRLDGGGSPAATTNVVDEAPAQKGGDPSNGDGTLALLFGGSGALLNEIGGSIGKTAKGEFRFYDNAWRGNQYMTTFRLAEMAKPLGPIGFGLGVLNDGAALRNGDLSPGKAALNTAMGLLTFTRYSMVGLSYTISDMYGAQIYGGAIELLIEGQKQ